MNSFCGENVLEKHPIHQSTIHTGSDNSSPITRVGLPEPGNSPIQTETVTILPIGSGGEVGRSCVVLKSKNRTIMFDCGNHPAKNGLDSLPYFDSITASEVELVLITHFHLDHCAALPYFCEQTNFKGRIFMTSSTKAFFKIVMNDFLRVGQSVSDIISSDWLSRTLQKIETIEYHEEKMHNGIRFQAFNAGHVLGAAMFLVEVAGVRTLYTGDFSRTPDRHLLGAELPTVSPDILIVESTNGIHELESREERETKFVSLVQEVVRRGGRCLVPVFALGRAQELLLILEELWESRPDLQHIPIYYASSLAQRCMRMYKTFVNAMNDRIKSQHASHRNPFEFRFITSLTDSSAFEDTGPCVVLASPGMLQSGISLELFERWCGDVRNGIIIAGYCVDGTIAKEIMSKPREITKPDGMVLKIRMKTIETVSFSAHSDGRQTRDFIREMPTTKHVVLVHGNANAMSKLKEKLTNDFNDRYLSAYVTANEEPINLIFEVQRVARVIGQLATQNNAEGSFVNGVVLVSGEFDYSIVHPEEINTFTGLRVSSLHQSMVLPLSKYCSSQEIIEKLQNYFSQSEYYHSINLEKVNSMSCEIIPPNSPGHEQIFLRISEEIFVRVEQSPQSHTILTIAWKSSRMNDLIADVTCIVLSQLADSGVSHNTLSQISYENIYDSLIERNHGDSIQLPLEITGRDKLFRMKCFHQLLSQFYYSVQTNLLSGASRVTLESGMEISILDGNEIDIDPITLLKYDISEINRLKVILKRIYLTLFPIPVGSGWCDCGLPHD